MKFLVIEGNIGAGKTTLAKKIAEDKNAKLILEQFAENPFLPKFYENPERYSFPLELSFLAERYRQLKEELVMRDLFQPMVVSDYYFMKSLIFSKQTLGDDEYNLYKQLFNIIYKSLPKPDLLIYLNMSPERLLRQIKMRGREYELNITREYLNKIHKSYSEYFKQAETFPVLLVEADNADFINNKEHYTELLRHIFNFNPANGLNYFNLTL